MHMHMHMLRLQEDEYARSDDDDDDDDDSGVLADSNAQRTVGRGGGQKGGARGGSGNSGGGMAPGSPDPGTVVAATVGPPPQPTNALGDPGALPTSITRQSLLEELRTLLNAPGETDIKRCAPSKSRARSHPLPQSVAPPSCLSWVLRPPP